MSHWGLPVSGAGFQPYDYAAVGCSPGVNAYGSWQELSAGLSGPVHAMRLRTQMDMTTNPDIHFQVGIGAAGSEVVLLDDFYRGHYGQGASGVLPWSPVLPLDLPAGTRVAVRSSVAGSVDTTPVVYIQFLRKQLNTRCTGGNAFDQQGSSGPSSFPACTQITYDVTLPWVEVIASTPRHWHGFWVHEFPTNASYPEFGSNTYIGIGSAGAESSILWIYHIARPQQSAINKTAGFNDLGQLVQRSIPAGSRIAVAAWGGIIESHRLQIFGF